jgi:hypothetical protein
MRRALSEAPGLGTVVIGEGENDGARCSTRPLRNLLVRGKQIHPPDRPSREPTRLKARLDGQVDRGSLGTRRLRAVPRGNMDRGGAGPSLERMSTLALSSWTLSD